MRTLIVDRDRRFVERLAAALTLDGYEVSTRSSGRDAIELLADHPPDALLLECYLADLDGTEVCRRARRLRGDLRILMFSYGADVAERVRGLEGGADACMSKPLAMSSSGRDCTRFCAGRREHFALHVARPAMGR